MRAVRQTVRIIQGLTRSAISAAVIVALVLVVPYLLIRYVGNPLPAAIPTWDEVELSLRSRQVDDSLIIQALAIIVWIAWAQLLLSLLHETKAAARGATSTAVRGLGATQWLARRLVAQFTLASTLFVQSSVGVALPAAPALADVVPALVITDDTPTRPGRADDTTPAGIFVAVDSSDTLWDLAVEHLGDGTRWTEIRDANAGREVAEGTVLADDFVAISGEWSLLVPSGETGAASATHAGAETVIGAWRVEPGDHFWKMAETVLGEGWGRDPSEAEIRGYWLDIIGHNRGNLISPGNDPNLIYADQSFEILLPPLPPDRLSAGDSLATTTPRPLTAIPQFERSTPPPPTHREPREDQTAPAPDVAVEPEGPVVEITGTDTETPAGDATPDPIELETGPGTRGQGGDGLGRLDGWPAQMLAIAGIGITGVAGAIFLNSLRARRRYQAARRRPGSIPDLPDEAHYQFETRVRSIADHEALRWLTAANKFLTHTLDGGESWHLPAIVAMRAGDHGLEVLLDEEATAPRGFIDGDQPRSWILDPDIEVRQLEGEAKDRIPYAPLLLPVGGTGGGDLLLDLAQLGVIGLTGPDEAMTGWLRSLTVAVASASWAQDVRVVAVGVDPALERMPHVEVPPDPVAWARDERSTRQAEGPSPDSRYEQRLRGRSVAETLVLVGPGHEGVAQHLVEIAELVNTPLTLIAAAPVRAEARIQFEGDRATLEPTGVTFWPSVMEAEAIAMTTTLLDQAGDTGSVPVDVHYADEVPGVRVTGESQVPLATPTLFDDEPIRMDLELSSEIDDERDPGAGRPAPPPQPTGPPSTAPSPAGPEVQNSTADPEPVPSSTSLIDTTPDRVDAVPSEAVDVTDDVADRPEPSDSDSDGGPALAEPPERGESGSIVELELASCVDDSESSRLPTQSQSGYLREDQENGSTDTESLHVNSDVDAEIAAVLRERPIEVSILRPAPSIDGTEQRLTPKNASVVAYLAFHRTATSSAVRDVFWPSSVNRSTSDNAISRIRGCLGKSDDARPRLNLATEGRFSVSDDVGCDWTRFQTLVGLADTAKRTTSVAEEMAFLRAALRLVGGPIATDVDPKNWLWLRDDPLVYSAVETAIVDAAHRLGYLGCEHGMPDLARWAADKGLTVVPEQEALYRIQMSAASLAGDEGAVQTVFRQARRSAQPNGDGVQPETELLYRRLVGLDDQNAARRNGAG